MLRCLRSIRVLQVLAYIHPNGCHRIKLEYSLDSISHGCTRNFSVGYTSNLRPKRIQPDCLGTSDPTRTKRSDPSTCSPGRLPLLFLMSESFSPNGKITLGRQERHQMRKVPFKGFCLECHVPHFLIPHLVEFFKRMFPMTRS